MLIKCETPLRWKGFSHFINKNNVFSVFAYVVGIYLTSSGLNDDDKPGADPGFLERGFKCRNGGFVYLILNKMS